MPEHDYFNSGEFNGTHFCKNKMEKMQEKNFCMPEIINY